MYVHFTISILHNSIDPTTIRMLEVPAIPSPLTFVRLESSQHGWNGAENSVV